ncbi:uncharacterized protein LOC142322627 isoform X2 [Lycorma delicatula]|uniref:uncharacterized protein LOC142322627 isoform X2 n=1 Tax=Lycorma delicatula TaxID=130591 RepID=UPI003F5107B6
MEAPVFNTFLDEDPLTSEIKKELEDETEQNEYLFAPVSITEDELTSENDIGVGTIGNMMDENTDDISILTAKDYSNKKINSDFSDTLNLYNSTDIIGSCTKNTVEKEYKCMYCQRSFNQSSNLKNHLSVHTDRT